MGYAEVKQKGDRIVQAVEECALLVGPDDGTELGGVAVGMDGMGTRANALQAVAGGLRESRFVTMFMGTFNNGKSTVVNALLGSRRLHVAVLEATAVISKVVYGPNEDAVTVFYNDGSPCRVVSADEFMRDFKLNNEERKIVNCSSGVVDRFANVDYVQLESADALFRDGVQFVDTPGLSASLERTERTEAFTDRANAVVYLLNAVQLFSTDDKEHIYRLFVRPKEMPKNVFFLVNKIDLVDEYELEEVRELAYENLEPVFTRDGVFDSDLMNARVFFVNAKGALIARMQGLEPEGTGISEFQEALEAYLTSDDRVVDAYRPALANMAAAYVEAKENSQRARRSLSAGPEKLRARAKDSKRLLDDLEHDIERMSREVNATKRNVTLKVFASLHTFLSEGLLDAWEGKAEAYDKKFGVTQMVKLALPTDNKKKEELLRPMTDYIHEFVSKELKDWADQIESLIQPDLQDLEEELESQGEEFELHLSQIMSMFDGVGEAAWGEAGKPNPVQIALSLIQGDVSSAVQNAAGGNFTWGEYVSRYVKQALINVGLFVLVGGGIPGLIAAILAELIGMRVHANSSAQAILNNFADQLFHNIRDEVKKAEPQIEASIGDCFDEIETTVTKASRDLVNDERARQASILRKLDLAVEEVEAEFARQDQVLQALRARVIESYGLVYERELLDADIAGLAVAGGSATTGK